MPFTRKAVLTASIAINKMVLDNFKNGLGVWVKNISSNSGPIWTQSGTVWSCMSQRCKMGGSVQKAAPRYIGCTMSENFKDFQFFAEWHMQQIGFGFEGYQIDKDILVAGNKLYSEHTCVLVPQALNKFLLAHNSARGLYPQGVSLHKQSGKFQAKLRANGKDKFFGLHVKIEDAERAYEVAKEAEAKNWYFKLIKKDFIVDPRVVEAMRVWKFNKEL